LRFRRRNEIYKIPLGENTFENLRKMVKNAAWLEASGAYDMNAFYQKMTSLIPVFAPSLLLKLINGNSFGNVIGPAQQRQLFEQNILDMFPVVPLGHLNMGEALHYEKID